jgi:hypothetical protein
MASQGGGSYFFSSFLIVTRSVMQSRTPGLSKRLYPLPPGAAAQGISKTSHASPRYGIETGARQLIRDQPLETRDINVGGVCLVVPAEPEMLRIKAVLILKRKATRDYLDFVALAERLGPDGVFGAVAADVFRRL